MKKILQLGLTISIILGVSKSNAQQWSVGIKLGATNHYFQQPFKKANTSNSTTTLNHAIFINKTWGKNKQFLTSLSIDYYRNSLPAKKVIGPVHDINNYYTININGSFLFLDFKKQNWKHYIGPTISYTLTYTKWKYRTDYPMPYTLVPENPSHSFWLGIDYTGKVGVNNRLSILYNLGALAGTESYSQFRFRGNIGIGYSFSQ